MPKAFGLFDALEKHGFSEDSCFLCGAALTPDARSDEHVFPKWLQKRYSLWDQRITLLNGTTLPYRQLKIPCCLRCNNEHLSSLENRVQTILARPGTSLAHEEERDLHLWAGKLMFGLLYRELLLPMDRKEPHAGRILEREAMERFRMLHFFLQSVRIPMRFLNGLVASERIPASLLYFDLQCPLAKESQFDFKDNLLNHCVYLRLGEKGVVAAFDGGAQALSVEQHLKKYAIHVLHPVQFEEIGAKVFYKASTLNRIPYYMIMETSSGRLDVLMMAMDDARRTARVEHADLGEGRVLWRCTVPPDLHGKPIYDQWSQEQYAKFLSFFTGVPIKQLSAQPGLVMSWLTNERGEFTRWDLATMPYGAPPEKKDTAT